MRDWHRLLILIALLFVCVFTVTGQKKNQVPVTADFRNANMEQFVSELEKQTGLHFYYDPVLTDSIKINLSIASLPVEKIMDMAFAGSDFFYSIDEEGQVYITKRVKIRTSLPLNFFLQNNPNKQKTADTVIAKVKQPASKDVQAATADYKVYEIGNRSINDKKTNKATVAG